MGTEQAGRLPQPEADPTGLGWLLRTAVPDTLGDGAGTQAPLPKKATQRMKCASGVTAGW